MLAVARPCEVEASKIASLPGSGGIWQGSYPQPGSEVRRCGYDVLVLCAQELQTPAELYPAVRVIHVPLDDGELSRGEWIAAQAAAAQVASLVGHHRRRVLVTCAQGRNRSGLVTALALVILTGSNGERAVRHVQARRRGALTNPSFTKALQTLRGRRR